MGAAYGHMDHPFDDRELTFGDLKNIIEMGLSGNLDREDNVTEKLDGQNLMISWKNGELVAARNKGHLKNKGENSLNVDGIMEKFEGRGDIYDAFSFAMKDLESAISSLDESNIKSIFNEGENFMNLEVVWPASANVIDYDVAQIIFHGALRYNDVGNVVGEVEDSALTLSNMIEEVNGHIQENFNISRPQFLKVPRHQNFSRYKRKYFGMLNKLQREYLLRDDDTVSLYHQKFWEEFIYNSAKQHRCNITEDVLVGLTKRWAFNDKSYSIRNIKKEIKHQKFLKWVLSFDKNDHTYWVKENMKPFERLFLEVGSEIMKNIEGFLAVNPNKTIQRIRRKVKDSIGYIKRSRDLKKIKRLKDNLEKLESIGGFDNIVPSEGIVFKYNGKTYKFTGTFANSNQIIGMMMY